MEEDDMYMVLPSNVQNISGTSNTNRADEYRTLLPRPLEVKRPEEWEVALSAISFPQSFSTFIKPFNTHFTFRKYRNMPVFHRDLQHYIYLLNREHISGRRFDIANGVKGLYEEEIREQMSKKKTSDMKHFIDVNDLLSYLNANRPDDMNGKFEFDPSIERVKVGLKFNQTIEFQYKQLADALGFDNNIVRYVAETTTPRSHTEAEISKTSVVDVAIDDEETEITKKGNDDGNSSSNAGHSKFNEDELFFLDKIDKRISKFRKYTFNPPREHRTVIAPNPPLLKNRCYNIFVYSNLVKSSLVGTDSVPLLRTIPIDHDNDEKYIGLTFDKLQFRTLASDFFEVVEIKLTDEMGAPLAFRWGKVIVTLRIRRKK